LLSHIGFPEHPEFLPEQVHSLPRLQTKDPIYFRVRLSRCETLVFNDLPVLAQALEIRSSRNFPRSPGQQPLTRRNEMAAEFTFRKGATK
jgi:hypothetical protein